MNVKTRADELAITAVKNTLNTRLRRPSGLPFLSVTECVDQLTALLAAELDVLELARFAAVATYESNLFREQINSLTAALSTLSDTVNSDESKDVRAKNFRKALVDLENHNPVVWVGVDLGQIIGRTLKASDAGIKSKHKTMLVKAYAIELYLTGSWKSMRQARDELWPQVQAKALNVGWAVTPTQGPETLYKWLRDHNKANPSAS